MNKRIGYIDALRGITMLLVVFSHVEVFSFYYMESFINSLFITFRMPLFFFISGFIAYKEIDWDKTYFVSMLKKKFMVQIVPTLFFCMLFYVVCLSESFVSFVEKGPRAYWFTVTLFWMFLLYYLTMYLFRKKSDNAKNVFLCLLSVIGIGVYMGSGLQWYNLDIFPFHCVSYLSCYFQFFVFGVMCKKYYPTFERIVSSDMVKAVVLLAFIGCFIVLWKELFVDSVLIYRFNKILLIRYLGLFLVFALFYNYRNTFDSNNRIVRGLRFIGRRTLDIYLLHYFFLPDLKSFASSYSFIFTPQNTVIELVVVLSFSIVIVLMCLGVSAIIRSSSLLGHYLFGAKR